MPNATQPDYYDAYTSRFGKPLFSSLWVKAWGEQYPLDIQPFSSCTYQLLDELNTRLRLRENDLLVDLGCGAGGVGLWFAQQFKCRLVGIDQSFGGIEIARLRALNWPSIQESNFHVATFEKLPIGDACAMSVISIDALPFAQDVDVALAEINRVLVNGGQLIFTTRALNPNGDKAKSFGVQWEWALMRNGFEVAEIYERKGVSELWRAVYDQWLEQEVALRQELSGEVVDRLLDEVRALSPKLQEEWPWLLISATKRL